MKSKKNEQKAKNRMVKKAEVEGATVPPTRPPASLTTLRGFFNCEIDMKDQVLRHLTEVLTGLKRKMGEWNRWSVAMSRAMNRKSGGNNSGCSGMWLGSV